MGVYQSKTHWCNDNVGNCLNFIFHKIPVLVIKSIYQLAWLEKKVTSSNILHIDSASMCLGKSFSVRHKKKLEAKFSVLQSVRQKTES